MVQFAGKILFVSLTQPTTMLPLTGAQILVAVASMMATLVDGGSFCDGGQDGFVSVFADEFDKR